MLCQVVARTIPKLIIIIVRAVQGAKADPSVLKGNSIATVFTSSSISPPDSALVTWASDECRERDWNMWKRKKSCHHHHIRFFFFFRKTQNAALAAGSDKHWCGRRFFPRLGWKPPLKRDVSKCKTNWDEEGKQHKPDIYFLSTPRWVNCTEKPITASTYFP